jgi:hypothetical protein
MPGRNQHHLWQLLQRGFGCEKVSKETIVYVYKKKTPPFAASTRDFGGERDFFDFSPGNGADVLITSTEQKLQAMVKHLQNGGSITDDLVPMISSFISHLETRTKFIRQEFARTSAEIMGELNRWFSNPTIFGKMMRKYGAENLDEIDTLLMQHVAEPEIRRTLAEFLIKNNGMIRKDMTEAAASDARKSMRFLTENLSQIAKESHINALLTATHSNLRVNRYEKMNYRVRSDFNGNLICPDTMVSFLTNSRPKPFLDAKDRLEEVWVPLTSDRMLVGESCVSAKRTNETVMRVLASTSFSAFIANSDSKSFRDLSALIGKNARILSDSEINSIKRSVLNSLT